MFSSKKTVATLKSQFTTMIEQLSEIINKEDDNIAVAKYQLSRAEGEKAEAVRFSDKLRELVE
jgi:hypothetical protein